MAEVLEVQAGEMQRIWRLARHSVQPDLLPGLADGLLGSFFAALGPALARGAPAEEVGRAVRGTVRLPPAGADPILAEEWKVAREVLQAACQSLGATEEVGAWLEEAGRAAEAAAGRALRGEVGGPDGVVPVRIFAGLELRPKGG
jgi:hypothetical protein